MNKSVIIAVVITILVLTGGVLFFSKGNKPLPTQTALEYYWGNGCPHCKNVADFMETWEKKDQIAVEKFEVWYSSKNAQRFAERAKICNIPSDQMGVPVLITPEGVCYTGDTPIIDYLKTL